MKALVSVIIPVFNAECYLAEAIQSVLEQTYKPLEILIIDDGSTDGSPAVARQFLHSVESTDIHFEILPHGGVSIARNQGVRLAKGEHLAFLDADDLWLPHKLERQMAALLTDPSLDLCFGQVNEFLDMKISAENQVQTRSPGQRVPGYIPSTMLVRKAAFLKVGFFEPAWQVAQFFEWFVLAKELGLHTVMLTEVVALRRLHINNLGIRQQHNQIEYVQIAKALLDRRRKAAENKEIP